jgi:molybdopterin synthase catalytic subunit
MVIVKLFAMLKERAQRGELILDFASGTVAELLKDVARECPGLAGLLTPDRIMVSVNCEFARKDALVKDGDEVALMPPFSGGSRLFGIVRIQQEPFSLDEEADRLKRSSPSIGGIVTFLGTTRDISRSKAVAKLDFEYYPGMAEKKLSEIRERAIKEFGVIDATIIHRIGTLPVGRTSC